jgi:hypothetical protein
MKKRAKFETWRATTLPLWLPCAVSKSSFSRCSLPKTLTSFFRQISGLKQQMLHNSDCRNSISIIITVATSPLIVPNYFRRDRTEILQRIHPTDVLHWLVSVLHHDMNRTIVFFLRFLFIV